MEDSVHVDVLGRCPACGAVVPTDHLLAKYAPADGWPRIHAECPGCGALRQPR